MGGDIGSDEGDDSAYEEDEEVVFNFGSFPEGEDACDEAKPPSVTPTTAGDTTSTAMASALTSSSGDVVAPGWEDVFGHPSLEGVAKEARLLDAGKVMLLLGGPLEEPTAASLPPATTAQDIVDGPTSGDGESLRAATTTAKVNWRRGVVVVKFHLSRSSSEINFTSHPFDFKSLHPFSTLLRPSAGY